MKTRDITYVALFAAITCVLAIFRIPLPFTPIPITLQVLAVGVAGAVLGAKLGFLSLFVYTLLGLIGLPVYSGFTSGPGVLFGVTGGYIFGFMVAAFVIGLIVDKMNATHPVKKYVIMLIAMIIGLVIIYILGALQMMIIADMSVSGAISAGIVPFILPDLAKMIVGSFVAFFVRNALKKENLL